MNIQILHDTYQQCTTHPGEEHWDPNTEVHQENLEDKHSPSGEVHLSWTRFDQVNETYQTKASKVFFF